MAKRWTSWLVVGVLGLAVAASADVVVLQNGDRIEGEIVSETPTEVLVKRTYKNSSIKFTEKIERSRIARIEKGESNADTSSATASAASSRPASSQPVALSESEKKELLKKALASWEKKDYAATGMTLSRLINGSSRDELARMSKELEAGIEVSLGDMAAEAHLQAAIARSRGQNVSLLYVTDYEKPYLVPRLIEAYKEALQQSVSPEPPAGRSTPAKKTTKTTKGEPGYYAAPNPPSEAAAGGEPPAQSQPAARYFVLASLLDTPDKFDGNREEALAVAKHIRHLASMLLARTRYDNEYKSSTQVKDELKKERDRLTALQKVVLAKTGEAATAKEARGRPAMGMPPTGQQGNRGIGTQGRPGGPGQDRVGSPAHQLRNAIKRQEAEEGGTQENENDQNR